MAFNITNFMGHLTQENEVAKTDKFEVTLNIPSSLRDSGLISASGNFLALSCEAAEFPGIDVTPIEYRHYGFIQRVPHHLTFQPITLTFYSTGKMSERIFFDTWINSIIPFTTGLAYYRDDGKFTTTITITQYNSAGDSIYSVDLYDAFPLSMTSMQTNWAEDNIHRFNVTLSYKKWLSNSGRSITSGGSILPPSSIPTTNPIAVPAVNFNDVTVNPIPTDIPQIENTSTVGIDSPNYNPTFST